MIGPNFAYCESTVRVLLQASDGQQPQRLEGHRGGWRRWVQILLLLLGIKTKQIEEKYVMFDKVVYTGSGCGSIVVVSNTRGLQFESSHRQNFVQNLLFTFEMTNVKS